MEMKERHDSKRSIAVRLPRELIAAIQADASRTGSTISEQVRYELAKPRGMWEKRPPADPTPIKRGKA